MKDKFYKILQNVLEVDVNDDTDISMQNCPTWTSLAHIDVIMSIEEEFDIRFKQEDLPNLTSQSKLFSKILELKNA